MRIPNCMSARRCGHSTNRRCAMAEEKKVNCVLGCDISCNSPAFVFIRVNPFFIGVLAYSERLILPESNVDNPPSSNFIVRIKRLPFEKGIGRYARFREDLRNFLCFDCPAFPDVAAVEDYAYGVQKTNSFSMLCEASAIIRLLFHYLGIPSVLVPISVNKKAWCGKGNATKFEMYQAFTGSKFAPHILQHPVLASSGPGEHPLQDVVDALALAHRELLPLPADFPPPCASSQLHQTPIAP